MQARFYIPWYGRFASPDPARDQHFELTQSWNIASYVQNKPINRVDPTGMVAIMPDDDKVGGGVSSAATELSADGNMQGQESAINATNKKAAEAQTNTAVAGSVGAVATRSLAAEFGAWLMGGLQAVNTAVVLPVAALLFQMGDKPEYHKTEAKDSPEAPKDLVGTQDDKSGRQGKRHNSGPLDPSKGGTGDAAKDFENLTGGKSRPAPSDSTLKPGSRIGDNKIQIRPGKPGEGPRIDIPASGSKPIETLHYPE